MIRLKYPVFIFTKDDPMVYVFHNDYDFRVTTGGTLVTCENKST